MKPDFYIEGKTLGSGQTVYENEPFSIWYKVCNKGVSTEKQFSVTLRETSSAPLGFIHQHDQSGLAIGECFTKAHDYPTGKRAGFYSWRVDIDSQDIDEATKQNNSWLHTLNVFEKRP
jgi:hypothetical protein